MIKEKLSMKPQSLLVIFLTILSSILLFACNDTTSNNLEITSPLKKAAITYFENEPKFITADKLYENLNDGNEDNNPYIISLRSAEDYAKGHIPGAVNISTKELFTLDTLKHLPTDKLIVVYCYTGQVGSQVAAILNMLGYNAKSLLHGMSAWTDDPNIFHKRFDPKKHAHEYLTISE